MSQGNLLNKPNLNQVNQGWAHCLALCVFHTRGDEPQDRLTMCQLVRSKAILALFEGFIMAAYMAGLIQSGSNRRFNVWIAKTIMIMSCLYVKVRLLKLNN
jgi:hypothetical protein